MTSPQKRKGDQAERDARAYLLSRGFEFCERIPAGADEDRGDLLFPVPISATCDVKAHKTPRMREWIERAKDQRRNANRAAGFVLVKPHGQPNPEDWHMVTTLGMWVDYTHRLLAVA